MPSEDRVARIRQELEQQWEALSEEISTVLQEVSIETDGQRTVKLKRKLSGLESERDLVARRIDRIEQGRFRLPEDIIEENVADLRKRMRKSSRVRTVLRHRIVNSRPPLILCNFKDREDELLELRRYLADSRVALTSVVGQAGIGKTALICKVFADLESEWKITCAGLERDIDGIVYLDTHKEGAFVEKLFSSVTELLEGDSVDEIRKYWSLEDKSLADRVRFLLTKLNAGTYLFVIDHCDDIIDPEGWILDEGARTFVETVLVMEQPLHVVITSGTKLQLTPSLQQRTRRVLVDRGLPLQLAAEYLKDLDPDGEFGLRDSPHQLLLEAARRAYGIPKALESIAGLMATDLNLTLSELLENERLFSGRVVENLIGESYQQLKGREKSALDVLAVYGRPVEFVAVAFVLNGLFPDMEVADTLKWLVNRHFASFDREAHSYSVHPLVRSYAYSHLSEAAREDYERRAALFFRGIRLPKAKWRTIDDIAPQLSEFQHLTNAGQYEDAANLLEEIEDRYLRVWGHYRQVLEMRKKLDRKLSSGLEAINQERLGRTYNSLGEHRKGMDHLGHALDLARGSGDPKLLSMVLGDLGLSQLGLSQIDKAMTYFNDALEMSRRAQDREIEAATLGYLGSGYRRLGQEQKATDCFREALALDRQIGNREGMARTLFDLGTSAYFHGELQSAKDHYEQSLSVAREVGHANVEGFALSGLGNVHLQLGDPIGALSYYEEALAKTRQTGHQRSEARNLGRLGDVHFQLGHYQSASEFHWQALCLAQKTEDVDGECIWRVSYALDLICLNDSRAAKTQLTEAIERGVMIFARPPHSHSLSRCYLGLAFIGLAIADQDCSDGSKAFLAKALSEFEQVGADTAGLVLPIVQQLISYGIAGLDLVATVLAR